MNLIGTKEGSALLFLKENEDGSFKSLKYDFKDSSFYASTRKDNWRKVLSAGTFFNGISPNEVIRSFEDEKYKEFLSTVLNGVDSKAGYGTKLGNVQVLLNYIPKFQPVESWILQGLKFDKPRIVRSRATRSYWRGRTEASEYYDGIDEPVNIFQKEVLQFMKELNEEYGKRWVDKYKQNKDLFVNLCTFVRANYYMDLEVYGWLYDLLIDGGYGDKLDTFKRLVSTYNMEYKALFNYLVTIDRTEALGFGSALSQLEDYIRMVGEMQNHRASKYPKNLTMRHNIVVRNYNAYQRVMVASYNNTKEQMEERENKFKANIDYNLDWMNDKYAIVSPIDPEEMVVEGNKLHHCVASYVKKVEDGTCQIMFMRDLEKANEPLVTIEIKPANPQVNYRTIGQVSQDENNPPTEEQTEVLKEFAKAKRIGFIGYDPTEDIKKDSLKVLKEKAIAEQKESDIEADSQL